MSWRVGEAAGGSEGPLTEWLVPGQPARQRVLLQISGGDSPGIRSTGCCRDTARGNDLGPLDHVHMLVDGSLSRTDVASSDLHPADDISSRTVRQPAPHHPTLAGQRTGQRVARSTSHQTRLSLLDLSKHRCREA